MGDFNLYLLHYTTHSPTQEFIDSLFSYGFYPLISKPTRITSHSATLIDNIFTNEPATCTHSCIVLNDISDHMPVVASFIDDLLPMHQEKVVKRSFGVNNLNKFHELLSQVDWNNKLIPTDANTSYNAFTNEYTRLFETCFPLKITTCKLLDRLKTPWLTKGLWKSIKHTIGFIKHSLSLPVRYANQNRQIFKINMEIDK